MPRGSVKDVKTKCRNMRKSKLKEVCENELTEEEMEIFLMKIADKYYKLASVKSLFQIFL